MGQIGYLFNLIFTFPIFNALMLLISPHRRFWPVNYRLNAYHQAAPFPVDVAAAQVDEGDTGLTAANGGNRKKVPEGPEAQAEATQALYKEYGINPLFGNCLPLLIQMPVLFGLFYALSAVLRTAKTVGDINKLLYPFIPHFTKFPNIDLNWFTFLNARLALLAGRS